MKRFLSFLWHNPAISLFAAIIGISAGVWLADPGMAEGKVSEPDTVRIAELPTAAQTTAVSTASAVSTAATANTTTAKTTASAKKTTVSTALTTSTTVSSTVTTTVTEPEPEEQSPQDSGTRTIYYYDFTAAGDSPNSGFYQDRLTIIGDSIAYGFNAYGYIPFEHNLAKESVSLWNLGAFTFDKGGGEMGIIDAADYVHPSLIYVSIGMNDLFTYSPDGYAQAFRGVIDQLLERIPGTTIVVGAITPVSDGNYFTDNGPIRDFNYALENMVYDMDSPYVYFFDAYSVLADPETMALSSLNSSGDGIHLSSWSYSELLRTLFGFLDYTCAIENIEEFEAAE